MKNLLFLLCGILFFSCDDTKNEKNFDKDILTDSTVTEITTDTSSTVDLNQDVSLPRQYSSNKYAFKIQLPENWSAVESKTHSGIVTSIFPLNTAAGNKLPLGIHQDAALSYIAVWPGGLGTEFPSGDVTSFSKANNTPQLSFTIDRENSKVFLLEDGTPWAYFIIPKNTPASWNKMGFIFAQIQTKNFQATCYDKNTGIQKPMQQCDPMMGDKVVRQGTSNKLHEVIIHRILSSIVINESASEPTVTEMIKIDEPLPNATIGSPLNISGKAKGNWMTNDFVPFAITLSFITPDNERGKLVFQRANPSGLKENAESHSIPLIFPPKK